MAQWWNTVGNIGDAAGALADNEVINTLARLGERRGGPAAERQLNNDIGAYIGAYGPRAVTGPARGSPAGLPVQASEASPFALTRERIQRELEDNPDLQRRFDRNTTAEVGKDPEKRRWYQALTIDRAVQSGQPLAEVVNNPNYYPPQTTRATATTGMGVDESIWAGANPANFATGNASYDPRTGRWVGFAGGPQTSTFGSGRGMELGGIEGQGGLPYARAMGYEGPNRTLIGPTGPQGPADTMAMGGWETTVGAAAPGGGGVGYVNPERVAQGATTDPEELKRKDGGFNWGKFLESFDFVPAKIAPVTPFTFSGPGVPLGAIGGGQRGIRQLSVPPATQRGY
jgi:hypothetical protein